MEKWYKIINNYIVKKIEQFKKDLKEERETLIRDLNKIKKEYYKELWITLIIILITYILLLIYGYYFDDIDPTRKLESVAPIEYIIKHRFIKKLTPKEMELAKQGKLKIRLTKEWFIRHFGEDALARKLKRQIKKMKKMKNKKK